MSSDVKTVAIKKGQNWEKAEGLREIGTVRRDGCGEKRRQL